MGRGEWSKELSIMRKSDVKNLELEGSLISRNGKEECMEGQREESGLR